MSGLTPTTPNYIGNLSLIESTLPNEILELIFNCFGSDNLHILCAVSHRWRSIALSQHHLWAQGLPRFIFLHQSRNKDPRRAHDRNRSRNKFNGRIQQCLHRSGTQPISFLFKCSFLLDLNTFWPASEIDALYSMLSPLVDEYCRWFDVGFAPLPMDAFQDILGCRVKGSGLKELRTLKLCIWPSASPPVDSENGEHDSAPSNLSPSTSPVSIDCFSNAPKLRDVDLNLRLMFRHGHPERQRPINIDLPWAQLESFKYSSHRDDGAYSALLRAHDSEESSTSSRLQVLDLFINRAPALPMFRFKSDSLHTLHLRLGLKPDLFCSHLSTLTLPSLQNLEIRGPFGLEIDVNIAPAFSTTQQHGSTLYTTVRSLIIRSGCSLKQLGLDMGWSRGENGDQQWEGLYRTLALSPGLRELDVAISHGRESTRTLQGLTVDVDEEVDYLCDTLLPDLQVLTFRLVSLPTPDADPDEEVQDLAITTAGQEEEDAWRSMDLVHIFDLASFERLIRSRTKLPFESPRSNGPPLVAARIVLPGDVLARTGPLLERIRCTCDFKVERPTNNAEGMDVIAFHWKGFNQDEEVLVLRRRSIASDPQGTEHVNGEEGEEITMSSVRTFPPGWTWDDET